LLDRDYEEAEEKDGKKAVVYNDDGKEREQKVVPYEGDQVEQLLLPSIQFNANSYNQRTSFIIRLEIYEIEKRQHGRVYTVGDAEVKDEEREEARKIFEVDSTKFKIIAKKPIRNKGKRTTKKNNKKNSKKQQQQKITTTELLGAKQQVNSKPLPQQQQQLTHQNIQLQQQQQQTAYGGYQMPPQQQQQQTMQQQPYHTPAHMAHRMGSQMPFVNPYAPTNAYGVHPQQNTPYIMQTPPPSGLTPHYGNTPYTMTPSFFATPKQYQLPTQIPQTATTTILENGKRTRPESFQQHEDLQDQQPLKKMYSSKPKTGIERDTEVAKNVDDIHNMEQTPLFKTPTIENMEALN